MPEFDDSIAIIGMSGQFPGADDLDSFWNNLVAGKVAAKPLSDEELIKNGVARERFGDPRYVKMAYSLNDYDKFDAEFFDINPREAEFIDPQQRLFLQTAWKALEQSGYTVNHNDLSMGVFAGAGLSGYFVSNFTDNWAGRDLTTGMQIQIGNDKDYICTRTSYKLNLKGPSVTVQAACSTSLVAVCQAFDSLMNYQCDVALAGGVTVRVPHEIGYMYEEGGIYSPDGYCRSFDEQANGTVFGSGVGVVVLKRLNDAINDGDHIHAVIKGAAVNNDGAVKIGFTAPSARGQAEVIAMAQGVADIDPSTIQYAEAHGTGTHLGDPIEIAALTEVFRDSTEDKTYCAIGSVKSNVGHLEAAAGIAAFIKTTMALENAVIPPSPLYKKPNPQIDFENSPFFVNTEASSWKDNALPRRACVSSFGIGGTNSHIIMEQAPVIQKGVVNKRGDELFVLSAKTKQALDDQITQYIKYLETHSDLKLEEVCYTAGLRRNHFNHRLSLSVNSISNIIEKLKLANTTSIIEGMSQGIVDESKMPKLAFLFTGQGSQYTGMAETLYKKEPVFKDVLDKCNQYLIDVLETPLLDVIFDKENKNLINQTQYTQPALYAIETGLAALWESWGIKPDVVLGHSVGEYAAACIAGVFTLEDGLKLIAARGRLMQALPSGGEMAAIMTSVDNIKSYIEKYKDDLSLAAINGMNGVVISGAATSVNAICTALEAENIQNIKLAVSHAFHSPLMKPMLGEFESAAKSIHYTKAILPIISNISGTFSTDEISTADYWVKHVSAPVDFLKGMQCLEENSIGYYIELGPKPTLLGMAKGCIELNDASSVASLHPVKNDLSFIFSNLAKLYVAGCNVNWQGLYANGQYQAVVLPTYPFQKKRFWPKKKKISNAIGLSNNSGQIHPLLGRKLQIAGSEQLVYENILDCSQIDFLNDHKVFDQVLFPGTGYVEIALAAGRLIDESIIVSNILLHQPLVIANGENKNIQCIVTPNNAGEHKIEIYSLNAVEQDAANNSAEWMLHMSGELVTEKTDTERKSLQDIKNNCSNERSVEDYYAMFEKRGISYGPMFKTIKSLHCADSQALAEIKLPDSVLLEADDYHIHPALLDACFQVFGATVESDNSQETYLPLGIDVVNVIGKPRSNVWAHATLVQTDDSDLTLRANISVMSAEGEKIVEITGLMLAKVNRSAFTDIQPAQIKRWLYDINWSHQRLKGTSLRADFFKSPSVIEADLQTIFKDTLVHYDLEHYLPMYEKLNVACVHYVVNALEQLGFEFEVGRRFVIDGLANELGIVAEHHRQFVRLIKMLSDAKIISLEGDNGVVNSLPEASDPSAEIEVLHQQYPALDAQLSLLINCGDNTADILRGDIDPLHIIFPNADTTLATRFYSEAPATKAMNEMVKHSIVSALAKLPKGRTLRILEIGSGTGGTTAFILPQLKSEQVEYTYSDISSAFFSNAKERFKEFPFVEFKTLNIENSPFDQGYIPQEFDLIVAANVLHATNNLTTTLQHAQQLLAANGMMVLFEGTRSQYLVDMIFGWTEGWWRFEDSDLRQDHPLVSLPKWRDVLTDVGFAEVKAFPSIDKPSDDRHHMGVIVAQNNNTINNNEAHSWVVLNDGSSTASMFIKRMGEQGDNCLSILEGNKFEQVDEHNLILKANSEKDFLLLADLIDSNYQSVKGIVNFWNLAVEEGSGIETGEDIIISSEQSWGNSLYLVKAMAASKLTIPPRLWFITRGAQAVKSSLSYTGLLQASVWGMAKSIAMEYPELQCSCIDLDDTTPESEVDMLAQQIWSDNNENQIAFRSNTRYIPRMKRCNLEDTLQSENSDVVNHVDVNVQNNNKQIILKENASYLITGGLGGIGLTVAHWMAERGAKRLVLVSRNKPSSEAEKELKELRSMGIDIVIARADISNASELAEAMDKATDKDYPLRGVVQSAGLLSDASLAQQDREKFIKVMQPKVAGAWNLHQQTLKSELDLFIVFSSVASIFGSPGQANHSASNAFLDMLVYYRQTLGLPAMSINWGAWSKVGSATTVTESNALFKGIDSMEPAQAIWAMEQLITEKVTQAAVLPVDWSQLASGNITMPLLADLVKSSNKLDLQAGSFFTQLKDTALEERKDLLTAFVKNQLMSVLGLELNSDLDTQQGLFDLGLDSLTSVEFRNRIQLSLNCTLASTLAFNYPSIEAVVNYLSQSVLDLDIPGVNKDEPENTSDSTVVEIDGLESEIDDMSDDDLQRLLEDELELIKQDV